MRIGMVVGEDSGDILGAGLMAAILKRFPSVQFEGVGGPRMLALGFHSLFPQENLAVMGFWEPLKRLPQLLAIRRHLGRHFSDRRPDVFIGIDSPEFNLALEQKLKTAGIPTVHYVSPSIWAWRQKRIFKIAKAVDLVLTLFPFEAEFYRRHRVPVAFVGHPLADQLPLQPDPSRAREKLGVDRDAKLVALMPGSRGGEVRLLGGVFLQTARWCLERDPRLEFIIPAANPQRREQLKMQLSAFSELPLRLIDGQSHLVMEASDAVLMASGTTTLEALLLKRPMVVAYKMAWLSYAIASRLLKSPYVALPNVLAGCRLVAEILQDEATPENLGQALMRYLDTGIEVADLQQKFLDIHRQLRCNASETAAQAVLELIGRTQC